ncbi:MAG: class II aldolase/adducin family protein [Alphaproteobacteria bacterium]
MTALATEGRKHNSLKGEVSEAEWETRVALAAGCRICHHFGWNNSIRNHFTARVPDEPDKFLMNPRGLMWSEITASDFLKVDFNGKCYTESPYIPGPAGLSFHGAVLQANPDRHCSIHLHETDSVVVSSLKDGLMFTSQDALILYNQIGYHDFEGLAEEAEEGPRIAKELGRNMAMIMWNHGILVAGHSIYEGFYYTHRLIEACQLQVKFLSTGREVREVPKEVCEHTYKQFQKRYSSGKLKLGKDDWDAYVRMVDRIDPSYRL